MNNNPPQTLLYKILVIGDTNTGKTSFIKRYVNNVFSSQCRSTIGVDFATKEITWDANTNIRIQLWDIAGQERYSSMTRIYFKDAIGAIIVFDSTNKQTLKSVDTWKEDLDTKVIFPGTVNDKIPAIAIAGKIDLFNPTDEQPHWGKSVDEMNTYCDEKDFIGWYETSAKDDIGINKTINTLLSAILEKQNAIATDSDSVTEEQKVNSQTTQTGPFTVKSDEEYDADVLFIEPRSNCC